MKKTYFAKLAILSFTVVAAFAFIGTPAQAATGTIPATVTIATPIVVTGDSALIFGTFTAPTTGTDSWLLNVSDGSLVMTLGTDGVDIFTADHHRGGFTITGEPLAAVTYNLTRTSNFPDANLDLVGLSWSPVSGNLDGSGKRVVAVGGLVEITTGASSAAGGGIAEITLTANY